MGLRTHTHSHRPYLRLTLDTPAVLVYCQVHERDHRQQLKHKKAWLDSAKESLTSHENEVADLEDMLNLLLENNDG